MYRLLAFIPFIMLIVAIPCVNREEPYILGLPFLLFWIALWVVLSSLTMLIVYLLDTDNRQPEAKNIVASEALLPANEQKTPHTK